MSNRTRALAHWLPLLAVFAVGAALRLHQIGEAPPGLYRDEAFYGLDALGVLRGDLSVYFVQNNGREGLFIYLLAPAIAAFGRTPEAVRLASALVGLATLPAVYLAGRGLFSHRAGVLSAAFLAVSFWHVAVSRVAYRAITLPLMLCLTVGLIALVNVRAPRRRDLLLAFAAGACFGGVFYTYTSAVFALAVVAAVAPAVVLWQPGRDGAPSATRHPLLLFAAGAALALAPLLVWLAQHADVYLARAGQVSILSPAINQGDLLGTLAGNFVKAAAMFNVAGDRIWRHNLAYRPAFDMVAGLFFVAGVAATGWITIRAVWAAARRRPQRPTAYPAPAAWLVLAWLAAFLAPTVLAEDTPHFLRAIGALPAACILAAVGMEAVLRHATRLGIVHGVFGFAARWVSPPAILATLLLGMSLLVTANNYFGDYVTRPIVGYWLEASNVSLAREVNQFTSRRPSSDVRVDERLLNDNPALRFLAPAVERGEVSRAQTAGLAPAVTGGAATLLLVDPNHDWTAARNALPRQSRLVVREGPLAQGDLEAVPRVAYVSVLAEPAADTVVLAELERGIRLQSAGAMPLDDGRERVTLTWSATQPITEDLAVFVHWFRDGRLVAQHDGSPAGGYLPMPTFRPGDQIVDKHDLRVPGGAASGDEIRVGVYRREGTTRLRVLDAAGVPAADHVAVPVFQ